MTYYYVYRITNLINNQTYVGCHQYASLDNSYLGSGILIKRAQKKYGLKNFRKDILFVFDNKKDMFKKEREVISTEKPAYNLHEGGYGGWAFARSKLAQKLKDNPNYMDDAYAKSGATRKLRGTNAKAGFKGKKHSPETKKRISESMRLARARKK